MIDRTFKYVCTDYLIERQTTSAVFIMLWALYSASKFCDILSTHFAFFPKSLQSNLI